MRKCLRSWNSPLIKASNAFQHITLAWYVTLLTGCPWGFHMPCGTSSVNLTWQSECLDVNKNALRVFKLSILQGRGPFIPPQLSTVWLQHFYECAKVNRIFFLIRKGRRRRTFKALRAISPHLYFMLKKHFNSLPCQIYLSYERQIPFRFWRLAIKHTFWIHNLKSCHTFFNGELDLQALSTTKTDNIPLMQVYFSYIFPT